MGAHQGDEVRVRGVLLLLVALGHLIVKQLAIRAGALLPALREGCFQRLQSSGTGLQGYLTYKKTQLPRTLP